MEAPLAIFELGINHLGDVNRAKRMIDVLISEGATHATIQALVDPSAYSRDLQAADTLSRYCIGLEDIISIIRYAVARGLTMGVTVLDPTQVLPLADSGAAFFKILSSDISFTPLHTAVVRSGLPFYLSTGACELDDIAHSLELIRVQNAKADVRLIHTVLGVPTPAPLVQLKNIALLRARFDVPVAYGQHSDISLALPLSLACGAESVFVYVAEELSAQLPDGPHAVRCSEVGGILSELSQARTIFGTEERVLGAKEKALKNEIRRSIVAARRIVKGERITEDMLAFKRPGTGRSVWELSSVVGSTATHDYQTDDDI